MMTSRDTWDAISAGGDLPPGTLHPARKWHLWLVFAVTILGLSSAPAAAAQVAIIANKSVPIDSVTQMEVLDIYTGELRRWKNGSPIVAYDLTAEGSVRDQFYEFIGRKSSRIKSIWMKNLLMGEGSPPESLKTEEDVIGKVARTPGAIGFVRPEMTNDSVKVLAVVTPSAGSD